MPAPRSSLLSGRAGGGGSDSLDAGGSVHSRSCHTKDEFCSVTVRKSDPKEKAGIRLELEPKHGRVKVCNIANNGLFADSEIEIGDIVLSINAKRLKPGEGPEVLVDVIRNADSKVTVVVKKTNVQPRRRSSVEDKKKMMRKKNQDDIQDNNMRHHDMYYEGVAHHNADGSLNLKGGSSTSKSKKSNGNNKTVVATTISATKASPDDTTAGIAFIVGEKQRLYIREIEKDSIFAGDSTDLEVGDRVLSINDMNFRTYADADYAQTIVKKAKLAVTLVVEKQQQGQGCNNNNKKRGKCLFSESSSKTSSSKGSSRSVTDSDLSSTDDSTGDEEEERDILLSLKQNKDAPFVIAAPKSFSKQDAGLTFRVNESTDELYINSIAEDSIFWNTSLEEGDVILSINNVSFRKNGGAITQKRALMACVQATESISLLVDSKQKNKTDGSSQLFQAQEFNLDASVSNLNWD